MGTSVHDTEFKMITASVARELQGSAPICSRSDSWWKVIHDTIYNAAQWGDSTVHMAPLEAMTDVIETLTRAGFTVRCFPEFTEVSWETAPAPVFLPFEKRLPTAEEAFSLTDASLESLFTECVEKILPHIESACRHNHEEAIVYETVEYTEAVQKRVVTHLKGLGYRVQQHWVPYGFDNYALAGHVISWAPVRTLGKSWWKFWRKK